MKRICSFLLMIAFFTSHAQQGGKITYYYQGQQLSFPENNRKVVVQLSGSETPGKRIAQISSLLRISDTAFKIIAQSKRLLARLPVANNQAMINQLRRQAGVDFVHPCFTSPYGKDMGYGDELVVKLKPTTTTAAFYNLAERLHGTVIKKYAFASDTYIISAGIANGYDAMTVANRFFESGLFVYAEPDLTLFDGLSTDPNDPLFNYQWSHNNSGSSIQYNGTPGVDMKVQQAWNLSTGGGIKVAVVDEGIDINHPDLKANVLQGFDCVSGTSNPGDGKPLSPSRGHGTSCAGIIAALTNNNLGVAGVAPDCRLIPVNLSAADGSFASYSKIAAGFDYAWQHGADIISNSWGGGSPSGIIEDAINRAITLGRNGKGTVVMFASGNENGAVYYPAILNSVIAVGGVNMCGQRKTPVSCDGEGWWGANYGIGLDISAPCVKILTTDISGAGGYNPGDYNYVFNGTSAATPNAAAVAALVLGANNNLTVTQVRTIIESTCDKLPAYSYSMNSAQPNGTWNGETGHGLVDALRAVQAAVSGNYCNVQVRADGPLRFCPGGNVHLSIINPVAGTSYQWRKDGVLLSNGNSITATVSGSYDVVATAANSCVAISAPVTVTNLANTSSLTASAGADQFVCAGQPVKLGGNPVAAHGAPWLANKRVFGVDRRSNSFIKFAIGNPVKFDTIAQHVVSDDALAINAFFTGGDFTPYGYYVIAPETNDLVKFDTASGSQQLVGRAVPETGFYWMGLTWDQDTKNLYAAATSGNGSKLYIIDPLTAIPQPVAPLAIEGLLWIKVRNNGDMYAMSSDQFIYRVNKFTGDVFRLPNPTGFSTGFEQDADFDPITDSLYLTARTFSTQPAAELRMVNTSTGIATVIGPLGDGLSQVDATGIAGPQYQYNWSPATGLSNTTVSVPVATPAATTLYTLNVTDMCGNTASSQVTVHVNTQKPVIAITAPKDSICTGETVRLSATQKSGYTYQWYYEGNPIPGATDSFYIAGEGGVYFVKAVMNVCDNTSLPFTVKTCEVRLNSSNPVSVCAGNFYDSGGRLAAYGANENFTRTITASSGNMLRVTFNVFNTEAGQDVLTIYDGPGSGSPVLAVLSGSPSLPLTYTASAGSLTFSFSSNSTVNMTGWEAVLSCYKPLVYRSKNSGLLSDINTWEVKSDNGFVNAATRPHLYDDSIIIRQGHMVTHTDVARLDQVTVQKGGTLQIAQSGFIDLADGPGRDLLVDGTLEMKDAASIDGAGMLIMRGTLNNTVRLKNIAVRTEITGTAPQTFNTTGSLSTLYVSNPFVTFNTANDVSIDTLIIDVANGAMKVNASQPSAITINKKLSLLYGKLAMGNNTVLNLAADAVIEGAGASSFVEGPVRMNTAQAGVVSMDFPIGNGVYRPIQLGVYISSAGPSAYQAEIINAAPATRVLPLSIGAVSAKRFYRISSVGASPSISSAIVVLSYGPDDGVTDAASLRMVKNDGNANWVDLGGVGSDNGSGTIISNVNFTSFGDFVLANAAGGANILPVQWLQVNATLQINQVLVTWKISDEINTGYYTVERSADGIAFNDIAVLNATATGAAQKQYETVDKSPLRGKNYYRIRETDKDGRYTYSKIVQVTVIDAAGLVIAPNPATETITIQNSRIIQQLECYNSNGQLVYHTKPQANRLTITVLNWAAGLYHVKIISNGQLTTARFFKN